MDVDEVQARLAQLPDRRPDLLDLPGDGVALRMAAVLLLLWEEYGEVWLALTRRGPALRSHPNEVALPGGACEPDEAPADAAVREAVEEIGIDIRQTKVVGRLDDAWSAAGHRIVPIVAWHYGVPRFRVDGTEVAEVIQIVVPELADPANHRTTTVNLGDIDYIDDVLQCSDITIVGLTADIIIDLVQWLHGHDRRRVPARREGLEYLIRTGRIT